MAHTLTQNNSSHDNATHNVVITNRLRGLATSLAGESHSPTRPASISTILSQSMMESSPVCNGEHGALPPAELSSNSVLDEHVSGEVHWACGLVQQQSCRRYWRVGSDAWWVHFKIARPCTSQWTWFECLSGSFFVFVFCLTKWSKTPFSKHTFFRSIEHAPATHPASRPSERETARKFWTVNIMVELMQNKKAPIPCKNKTVQTHYVPREKQTYSRNGH